MATVAVDDFANYQTGLDSPAEHAIAITKSDSNDVDTHAVRAIYCGGAGDIAVITVGGETVTFVGCLVGVIYPIRTKRVMSTNTSATNLVGLR